MTVTYTQGGWRDAAAIEYAERRRLAVKRRDKYAQSIANMQIKMGAADAEITELDRGARVFGLPIPEGVVIDDAAPRMVEGAGTDRAPGGSDDRQFKDIALDVLAKAYPRPLKALQVQKAAEVELGRTFHWKTAGMTLYRLKRDGLVRRSGQNWFWMSEADREADRQATEGVNDLVRAWTQDHAARLAEENQQDDLLGRSSKLEDIL